MGPLEAMVFLDASCYFWTRRGISARVHNERAAGRAGRRADRLAKLILDTSSGGRAGGRTRCRNYFWTRSRAGGRADRLAKLFLDTFPGGRAGGRADRLAKLFLDTFPGGRAGGQAGKVISGHVPGRVGGRAGGQAGKVISGHVPGRAGGQAGKVISGHVPGRAGGKADRLAKLFLDTFPGGRAGGRTGWQSDFWTRSRAGGRAGGQAGKVISGHVPGRAGGGTGLQNYFWTRSRAGRRAGGRTGWQSYFWTRLQENYFWAPLWAAGRAGGQACKISFGHVPGRAGGRTGWQSYFWNLVAWKIGEASHEMFVLEACRSKNWRSLARNARFGSLLLEKLGRPRTKSSFWKLVAWKVSEASHEMLVLEACCLKSCGSLARNARFGSLSLEKLRRSRTKSSFWKLVAWKVAGSSHEMLVLKACCLKSWRGFARNARFGSLSLEKLRRPRTKCSFWKLVAWKVEEAWAGGRRCAPQCIGEAARCTDVL